MAKAAQYDPATTKTNQLSEIGYKIFLDRYALKDGTKKSLKVGDTVVVCVDVDSGQREIGTVTKISHGNVSVRLRLEDTEVTRAIEHVDKPLETNPAQMHARIAQGIASVEKTPSLKKTWENKFLNAMTDFKFVPAGRILTGAGTNQALTYYNCYVIPSPHDSRGGIFETLSRMAEIMSRGGGVGINLSSLRPRYDYVKGVNGRSSGAVSWGSLYSFVTGLIEQGGSRRGALMLILNCWHPDMEEFITSKTQMGKITNANISVGITDDFMTAVKNNDDWDLIFPDKTDPNYDKLWDGNLDTWKAKGKKTVVYRTVKARELWGKIIDSAWASAEPGLFFIDRYNKMSPSSYFAPILCTNPCGEQGLPAWGVCNLGAINLAKFVNSSYEVPVSGASVAHALSGVNWKALRETTQTATRFLDNVIDATPYFFAENRAQQLSERRVGLNTMGLAEMMIRLGIRYGSKDGNEFIEKLYEFLTSESYITSAKLAAEKGSFPQFNSKKHLQTGFVKTLPKKVREVIAKHGLRNVTLNTQAPNGTIGTMVGTSTGIEPFYFWTYQRRSRLGIHEEKVAVYEEWAKNHHNEEKPAYFVSAMDLSPEEHIGVQAAIQRWIDSSISKTCNVPNNYTKEEVGELYRLMYDLGCKGGTVYRDGSRDLQILEHKSEEKANDSQALQAQKIELESTAITYPFEIKPRKRPEVMKGTTYKTPTAYGNMYITVNDDDSSRPYEIFTTLGKAGGFFSAQTEAISRLVSLSLRSGVSVSEVINQLKGIRGPNPTWNDGEMIFSIPDAVARILVKHTTTQQQALEFNNLPQTTTTSSTSSVDIGDLNQMLTSVGSDKAQKTSTTTETVTLANLGSAPVCPTCEGILVFQEGCATCASCGYSKCS